MSKENFGPSSKNPEDIQGEGMEALIERTENINESKNIKPEEKSTEEIKTGLQKDLEAVKSDQTRISQKNEEVKGMLKNLGIEADLGNSLEEEKNLSESAKGIQKEMEDLDNNKSGEKTEGEEAKEEDVSVKKVLEELEKMPEGERNKIEIGGHNIGFAMEKVKAKIFSGLTGFASRFVPEGGTANKFLKTLSGTYKNDAGLQERKMANAESEEGKKLLKTSNRLKAASNILKIASYIGNGPAMTVSSMFSRGMETVKQMRLGSEEVLEKTRIADEEKAAEEAWKIYNEARENSKGSPSKIDLQRAYEKNIPKDVLERLNKNKGDNVAQSFFAKMMQKPMELSAKRLDKKIQAIENDKKIKPEEKEARKNKLLDTYSRALNDLDGIVSKTGEVDTIAAGLKYAEIAGKGAMIGAMAGTVYEGLENVWNKMADIFSNSDMEEISDAVSEAEMTPGQLETLNKYKKWQEEFGAGNVFSDEELKQLDIPGGREDMAAMEFDDKIKIRLLEDFKKEYAEQGEISSWVDDSGERHILSENNGFEYEYMVDENDNLIPGSEKASGRIEGLHWDYPGKRWVVDSKEDMEELKKAMRIGKDGLVEKVMPSKEDSVDIDPEKIQKPKKRLISSESADMDAF